MRLGMKRLVCFLAAVAMLCSGMDGDVFAAPAKSVKSVVIKIGSKNYTKKTYQMEVGKTVQVKAVGKPGAAVKGVSYQSSDKSVATVTKKGIVKAKKAGSARITATVKGKNKKSKKAYMTIKAVNPASAEPSVTQVSSVSVNPRALSLAVGESGQLTVGVLPANATNREVRFSSSNPAVAAVSGTGLVTALASGEALVTASAGGKSASCLVTVREVPATGIKLNMGELTLNKGQNAGLVPTVTPKNATDKTVSFSSSDSQVVTVDENGLMTAVANGTAEITAQCGEVSAACMVNVVTEVTDISLNASRISMYPNDIARIEAFVYPEDASNADVAYFSSDMEVATVTKVGEVTAHREGEAVITARTKNGGFEASCIVNVKQQTSEYDIQATEGNAVYVEEKNAYEMYVGDMQEFSVESDTGAKVSFQSTDESVLIAEEIGEGRFRVKSVKSGIASVSISSVGDQSDATASLLFYVNIDRILVSEPGPIVKTEGNAYELTVSLEKRSGSDILEEELKGTSFDLKSKEYLFDAEYVEGSFDVLGNTALYRIGNVGHVVLDSGTGALSYQIVSFSGTLADGSVEEEGLWTSYTELVEGIRLTPFEETEGLYEKELYVGQDFEMEASPVNASATVKEFLFTLESQQPDLEGGEMISIVQVGSKAAIKALGAGTAEVLVSATDESGISECLTITVIQDAILVDPKTVGRVIKDVKADDSFSFTVEMSAALESGGEIDASESSPVRAASLTLRKKGDEKREEQFRCTECRLSTDRRSVTLTFSTAIYEKGTDEDSASNPCPLVTKNNAATGSYYLVSPTPESLRFTGYPDENLEEHPTVSYRETTTSQGIEGYVSDQKGKRLPGIQIRVGGDQYTAITDSDGHYFIYLDTVKISEVMASDPTGTYWDVKYKNEMNIPAGKKIAFNFTMEEQNAEAISLYGFVRGEGSERLGGATVKLQQKEGDSLWVTIAQTVSSEDANHKGKYVFENSEANEDGYSGEDALPPYIHRFEVGDGHYLSNDSSISYRVVAEKPVTKENLTDVYAKSEGVGKALDVRQASTSLGDIILEKAPETYTETNITSNAKEFRYRLSWDNAKDMGAGSTSGAASQTAATNVTGTANGLGAAKYKLSLIAPDGLTLLKEAEFTDTLVEGGDVEGKLSQMGERRDLIEAGFFGAEKGKPTLLEGTYYFIVDDGVNAYTVVPVAVNQEGLAVIDEGRCTVTIPFTQEIHTQTFIGSGSSSMRKLEMAHASGEKLARVLDVKGTAAKAAQTERIEYDVFQKEGSVEVSLGSAKDEANSPDGMTVQKTAEGISASHSVKLSRLLQGKPYCVKLAGNLILGELDQKTGAFLRRADNQAEFTRTDSTGAGRSDFRVMGTANINSVVIPISAFDQVEDASICVKSITLKKGEKVIGAYEAEGGQEVQAEGGSFTVQIPGAAKEFQCLEEGNDYSVQVEVAGYTTAYEEKFELIQYGNTTVNYNYEESSGKDIVNKCYVRIAERQIVGTLTDTDGNAVVDDQADTIDAVIYLFDAEKRLCGMERMGCGDVNGDTKAFQFVDGVNASIEGDGMYTLLARCTMQGNEKGKKFQVVRKEAEVKEGRCEDGSIQVATSNRPGATVSALILQENPIGANGNYGSNVSVLPSGAKAYAYEISEYYLPSPLDLKEDELDESRFAEGMLEQYQALIRDLDGHLEGIGRYEMRQKEEDPIYWETEAKVAIGHYAIFAQTQMIMVKPDAQTELFEVSKTFFGDNASSGYFEVTDSIGKYSYAFEIAQRVNQTEFMRKITVTYRFGAEPEGTLPNDVVVLCDEKTQMPIAYRSDGSKNIIENGEDGRKVTFEVSNKDAKYCAYVYRNGYYVGKGSFDYLYQQTTNDPNGNIKIHLEECM